MDTAQWVEYPLQFAFTARTSREVMQQRSTWLLRRRDIAQPDGWRYAEANFFDSLAPENRSEFLNQLTAYCRGELDYGQITSSAVRCAADMLSASDLSADWISGHSGISINGLIWMADKDTMARQISQKLDRGFRVLKLKIGGINFDDELDLIRAVRNRFSVADMEIRLDANGSFAPSQAMERLKRLSEYGIHSIEQPIAAGQWPLMAQLCRTSPIDIALDEELIGLHSDDWKLQLISQLSPAYLILKPSLCGGLRQCDSWIDLAIHHGVQWWLTSALESNIGLWYLGAYVDRFKPALPQGLGTGQIYLNNIPSPLYMCGARLRSDGGDFDRDFLNSLPWQ